MVSQCVINDFAYDSLIVTTHLQGSPCTIKADSFVILTLSTYIRVSKIVEKCRGFAQIRVNAMSCRDFTGILRYY